MQGLIYLHLTSLTFALLIPSSKASIAWKILKNFEYAYIESQPGVNWHDARQLCMEHGADLVSIETEAEYNFLKDNTEFTGNLWLGLNRLQDSKTWRWSDGTATESSHIVWEADFPQDGVTLPWRCGYFSKENDFKNRHCDSDSAFVCKRSSEVSSPTPKTDPTTPSQSGYCPAGYFSVGSSNKCYKTVLLNTTNGLSWDEAAAICREGPGANPDLASISSESENNAILAQFGEHYFNAWIGLRMEPEGEGIYKWSDNSPISYTNWGINEPSANPFPCVEMWVIIAPPGSWNDCRCSAKRGYVCQTYKDSSSPINTPPITPSHSCPTGFSPVGEACYKIYAAGNTWNAAMETICKQDGAELISMHTASENAALQVFLEGHPEQLTDLIWIGLHYVEESSVYYWSDNWHVTFTKWGAGQPLKGEGGGCVATDIRGHWSDVKCSNIYSFVCKITTVIPKTTPTPQGGLCPKNTTLHRWSTYGNNCYAPVTITRTWDQAQSDCLTVGASLASIHEPLENSFVSDLLSTTSNTHWIGMKKDGANQPYLWQDASEVEYVNWMIGEPNGANGSDQNCVRVLRTSIYRNWDDHLCTQFNPYVCKAPKIPPPTTPPPPTDVSGNCPTKTCSPQASWVHYGSDCFLFCPDTFVSWDQAADQCKSFGATLTFVGNQDENWFVYQSLQDQTVLPLDRGQWIGLQKHTGVSASFLWADGSGLNYTNWATSQPPQRSKDRLCVHLSVSMSEYTANRLWTANNCSQLHGFSCRTYKDQSVKSDGEAGVIAGAVIGVLLGLAALGVVGFFLYRKHQEGLAIRKATGLDNISYSVSEGSTNVNRSSSGRGNSSANGGTVNGWEVNQGNQGMEQDSQVLDSQGYYDNVEGIQDFGFQVNNLEEQSRSRYPSGRLAFA